MKCTYCESTKLIRENIKYFRCSQCFKSNILCHTCNTLNMSNSKFCWNCGTSFQGSFYCKSILENTYDLGDNKQLGKEEGNSFKVIPLYNELEKNSNLLLTNNYIALANTTKKSIQFFDINSGKTNEYELSINLLNDKISYNTMMSVGNLFFFTSGTEVLFIDTTLIFYDDLIVYKLAEYGEEVRYIHYAIGQKENILILIILKKNVYIYNLDNILQKCFNKNHTYQHKKIDFPLQNDDVLRIPVIIQNKLFITSLRGYIFICDINDSSQICVQDKDFKSLSSPVRLGHNLYIEYLKSTSPYTRGGFIFDTKKYTIQNYNLMHFQEEILEYSNLQIFLEDELSYPPLTLKDKDVKALFISQNIGSTTYYLIDEFGNINKSNLELEKLINAILLPSYCSIQENVLHVLLDCELYEVFLNPELTSTVNKNNLKIRNENLISIKNVKFNVNHKTMLFSDRIILQ